MRPGNAVLRYLALLSLVLLGLNGCAGSQAVHSYSHGVSAKRPDLKIFYYTKAIDLKPDYAFAYNNRGLVYSKKGLHDKAIADLNKAVALLESEGDKHDLTIAYDSRGVAHSRNGRYDQAVRDYTAAIQFKPDYAFAHNNRGYAYYLKRQYDRAIRDYTEAIRLKADYALAYNNRSLANSKKGLFDDAIADQTKAIALLESNGDKHDLAPAYNNRGDSYREKGSYDRAIADFHKAIELKPEYAHAYNHLAWVFATAPNAVFRNGNRAVELAERAVDLDWDGHGLDALAASYAEVGRYAEAVGTQLQAIDVPKKDGDESSGASFEKHLERYRTNKPWRMKEPGGTSGQSPSDTEMNNRAERYRAQGRYAEAEPLYARALAIREKALGPQHQDVATSLDNLALLYRAQGQHAEAEPLYQRALAIRDKARRREEARKRESQKILEALSGRYATNGERSKWDISFQGNRFEVRFWIQEKWKLWFDGDVTDTRLHGLVHSGGRLQCGQSRTTPLRGSVDLRRKSFELSYDSYDLTEWYTQ